MPKKLFPSDLVEQAKSVLDAWGQIDDQLTFGPVNAGALTMDLNFVRGTEEQITNLENKLTDIRNQRDAYSQAMWDKVKRVRAGVKAIYGDDSSQYEMVGGTRLSDRKPMRRTAIPIQ
jgi:hypothetical protein